MGRNMQNAMVVDAGMCSKGETAVPVQQMPLTFMRAGDSARIVKVRGRGEVHHHLENLGFIEGAEVRVVTEQSGNLIVEIKGAQVALDRSVASKIIAC